MQGVRKWLHALTRGIESAYGALNEMLLGLGASPSVSTSLALAATAYLCLVALASLLLFGAWLFASSKQGREQATSDGSDASELGGIPAPPLNELEQELVASRGLRPIVHPGGVSYAGTLRPTARAKPLPVVISWSSSGGHWILLLKRTPSYLLKSRYRACLQAPTAEGQTLHMHDERLPLTRLSAYLNSVEALLAQLITAHGGE